MRLVETSPISNNIVKDSLTYFSSKNPNIGDIVEIKIKNKKYKALVIDTKDLKKEKISVRKADFSFKKIENILGQSPFYEEFFHVAKKTKDYFVSNPGQIINYFLPKKFLENFEILEKPKERKKINFKNKSFFVINSIEKRIDFYKKYIKEKLEIGQSVFFVVPTKNDLIFFEKNIGACIKNIKILGGIKNEKKLIENYNEILKNKNPSLVLMTPQFLFTPKHNLGSIIIENEISGAYKTLKKPYFDIKIFAHELSKALGTDFILAGEMISVENYQRFKKGTPTKTDYLIPEIINLSDKNSCVDQSFIISKKLNLILKQNSDTFLFVLRKGYAPQVICNDCGHIITDDGSPLVLIEKNGKRFFQNTKTKKLFETKICCPNCKSWNLKTLGVGIDLVFDEIKKRYKDKKIYKLDKENKKELKEKQAKIKEEENKIVIGTEFALQHLEEKYENICIISFDSLFFIPSFKINEKIFNLIQILSNKSSSNFLIQTRQEIDYLIDSFIKKDIDIFYKKELEQRKIFNYPPFSTVIKISKESRKEIDKEINDLSNLLSKWGPVFKKIKQGKKYYYLLFIKIDIKDWNEGFQDIELKNLLFSLCPDWKIKINPDSMV